MHSLILQFKEELLAWLDEYKADILSALGAKMSDFKNDIQNVNAQLQWADDKED